MSEMESTTGVHVEVLLVSRVRGCVRMQVYMGL